MVSRAFGGLASRAAHLVTDESGGSASVLSGELDNEAHLPCPILAKARSGGSGGIAAERLYAGFEGQMRLTGYAQGRQVSQG